MVSEKAWPALLAQTRLAFVWNKLKHATSTFGDPLIQHQPALLVCDPAAPLH
jgi:hypothetical protein